MASSWMPLGVILIAVLSSFDGVLCSQQHQKCKKGYQNLGDSLCVKHFNAKKTWPLAREHCQSKGGDLLSLKDDEKLYKKFKAMSMSTNGWIGLNKRNTIPHYVWLDDSDIFSTVYKDVSSVKFPRKLKVGTEIVVKGQIHNDIGRMGLYLLGSQSVSSIGLYVNPQFDTNSLNINHRKGAKFGKVQKGQLPLNKGENFEIRIKAQPSGYRIMIDSKLYSHYDYFLSVEDMESIRIVGKVTIHSITLLEHKQTTYTDFLGNFKHDTALDNCVLFHTLPYTHGVKGWKSDKCVKRQPYFCSYNKNEVKSTSQKDLTPFSERNLECPDPSWTLSEGSCFKVFYNRITFRQARIACYKEGGDLAQISTDNQRLTVKKLLLRKSRFWVGVCDVAVEDSFEFVSGAVMPSKFNPWSKGKPNRNGNNDEDCAEMGNDGYWGDNRCEALCDYVCGIQAQELSPCKPGYSPVGLDLCVKYHSEAQPYSEARDICKGEGTDLLTITDIKTNNRFNELVKKQDLSGWIGLNRIDSSPNYVWLDGDRQPVTFTDFLDGKESDSVLHKCVHFDKDKKTGKVGWESSDCAQYRSFFSGYSRSHKGKQVTGSDNSAYTYECPDSSWTLVDKTCIKAFSDDSPRSFDEARKTVATKYGGDLVEIDNNEMNNKVKGLIQGGGKKYWIGTSDLTKEGSFTSVSGKPLPPRNEFNPWNWNEPNGGTYENCLESYSNGKWNDLPCKLPFNWIGQVRASKVCKDNCLNVKVTPPKATEKDKEVTIRFDGAGVKDASKVISMTVYRTDSVYSSVTLLHGDKIVTGHSMTKSIKTSGHIDIQHPTKSYLSTTFTKPTVDLTGVYRCRIVYLDKNTGYVKTVQVSVQVQVEACQSGYTLVGGDMCVKYHSMPQSYYVAREMCKREGNDLVVLRDDKTNTAFKEFISKKGGKVLGWIGLNRINTDPTFVWLDRYSEPATFTNFVTGKKDESLLNKCVQFTKVGNGKGDKFGWEVVECTKRLPFCSGYVRSGKSTPVPDTDNSQAYKYSYECPDSSWSLVDKTCIKAFSDEQPKTFDEARNDVVTKYGGDLVEIVNKDMNSKVQKLLKAGKRYWIGVVDIVKEGTFESISTGKPLPPKSIFNPWNPHEPSNGGNIEDWVEMRPNGRWNDLPKHIKLNWVGQVKARKICTNCLTMTINPVSTSEINEDDITISCKASGLASEAVKIVSIQLYRPDTIASSITVYSPNNLIVTRNRWSQNMRSEGHIDEKVEKSYLTATLMTPDLDLAGNYRCAVIYEDKNKVTKQVETSFTLKVEPVTTELLMKTVKEIRKTLKDTDNDVEKFKQSIIKREKDLVLKFDNKVVGLKKKVESSQDTCCPSLATLITKHSKSIKSMENTLTTIPCPKDWSYFNGLCYREYTHFYTWYKALEFCQKLGVGGTLAQIYDKETNNFLQYKIKWQVTNGHWVGLSDRKKEGVYQWEDGKKATYFNWSPSWKPQPHNDCTDFFPQGGSWKDYRCDSYDQFICQASPLALLNK